MPFQPTSPSQCGQLIERFRGARLPAIANIASSGSRRRLRTRRTRNFENRACPTGHRDDKSGSFLRASASSPRRSLRSGIGLGSHGGEVDRIALRSPASMPSTSSSKSTRAVTRRRFRGALAATIRRDPPANRRDSIRSRLPTFCRERGCGAPGRPRKSARFPMVSQSWQSDSTGSTTRIGDGLIHDDNGRWPRLTKRCSRSGRFSEHRKPGEAGDRIWRWAMSR